MDLDDELFGTGRAKHAEHIKEADRVEGDDLGYGAELGGSQESSEEDNYYYGVSLKKGQQHKQVKSVDQPSTVDMGLGGFGSAEPKKAEAQGPDPGKDPPQKEPANGARPVFSFDREPSSTQPAGYAQAPMPHSPGAAAVPFGQFNQKGQDSDSLPAQQVNKETPSLKQKKRRRVNDDYGIFYNYTNGSESSQDAANLSKPASPEMTAMPCSPNGAQSQVSFGQPQFTLGSAQDRQSASAQGHRDQPGGPLHTAGSGKRQTSGSGHGRTESGNIDTQEADERDDNPQRTYKPYASHKQPRAAPRTDKDRLESVAMLNMYNQNHGRDDIVGLFDDDLVTEMVMSRVDWIIALREIFYRLQETTGPDRGKARAEGGMVRGDKLFRQLVRQQDALKLIPRDEYAMGQQRHEIEISYGQIIRNLKHRLAEQGRAPEPSLKNYNSAQTGKSPAAKEPLLTLDQVIDLPFNPTSKSVFSGTEVEGYTDVQHSMNTRHSRASPLLSNAMYDHARVGGFGIATAQDSRDPREVELGIAMHRRSTPQIHVAHEGRNHHQQPYTQKRGSSVDSGVRPGLSSEDMDLVTSSRDSHHDIQSSLYKLGGKQSVTTSRNAAGAGLTDSGRKRSQTTMNPIPPAPGAMGLIQQSVSIPNFRSPSKQGHAPRNTWTNTRKPEAPPGLARGAPRAAAAAKRTTEWQPLDSPPEPRTSQTPMDQPLDTMAKEKFAPSMSPPALWGLSKKLFEANHAELQHPPEHGKHAAAVDRGRSGKGSPRQFVRSQKLHLKERTPHPAKPKKKTDSKKVARPSPSGKRKTPSQMPRKEINWDLHDDGDGEDGSEGTDDLTTSKQDSASKLAGTVFSSSPEKQASLAQTQKYEHTAMTAHGDNQEEDDKSNASGRYKPLLSFPGTITQQQRQQLRAHRSTEELPEFTGDGSRTNLARLEANISGAGNEAEQLSLGNPLALNTMNSSQWQNLLKQATDQTPGKSERTGATVLTPSAPHFESFLNGSQPAIRESINSVVQQSQKKRGGHQGHKQRLVPLDLMCGLVFQQDGTAGRKEFFDMDFYNKDLKETQPMTELERRKGIKTCLRSINLGRNLLKSFYELGLSEARQLLILNLSLNKIETLGELAHCTSLQFLNLAYNQIKSATEVNLLRKLPNLQELYLAHNFVDFAFSKDLYEIGGGPARRNYAAVWPHMEILDLSSNNLSDIGQVEYLFSGMFLRTAVVRFVSVYDNYLDQTIDDFTARTQEERLPAQVDFGLSYYDLLGGRSKFTTQTMNPALAKACIGCADVAMMQTEVCRQIEKLELIRDRSERRSQNFHYHKKTPTQLSYLLKGQYSNVNGPRIPPMRMAPGGTHDTLIHAPPKTPAQPSSNSPVKTHVKSPTAIRKKFLQIPFSSITENIMLYSKSITGRNMKHQAIQSQSKNISRTHSNEEIKSAYLAESPPVKSKRASPRHGPKFAKTGIKQVQMVFINPSRCGSRRSSSIPSNPTSSRQSIASPHQGNRSLSGDRRSINNAYHKAGPTRNGKSMKRNRSFSSRHSNSQKNIVSPRNRLTSTPLIDSFDTLPVQKDRPAQMLGLLSDQKRQQHNPMMRSQQFSSLSRIPMPAQAPQKKPDKKYTMKVDKVVAPLASSITNSRTPNAREPAYGQPTTQGKVTLTKKPSTMKSSAERTERTPQKRTSLGRKGTTPHVSQKVFVTHGANKGAGARLKGLQKIKKESIMHSGLNGGMNSDRTDQTGPEKAGKPPKMARDSSKDKRKSQVLTRNPSNESSFLQNQHSSQSKTGGNAFDLVLGNLKSQDKGKAASNTKPSSQNKTPLRTFYMGGVPYSTRGKSISMQKVKTVTAQGLQPYSSASSSLKQLTFGANISGNSTILQKLQLKNKFASTANQTKSPMQQTRKLKIMASLNKPQERVLSNQSSQNTTANAIATNISVQPPNLSVPGTTTALTSKVMASQQPGSASQNNLRQAAKQQHNPLSPGTYTNHGLTASRNDESGFSAHCPPSPRACEALLAPELLESEATIPRSHKTHKTSSFVKSVGANKEKGSHSFNSFLKNLSHHGSNKKPAAPENGSTLTANTTRLKEMKLVKPPSGMLNLNSNADQRQKSATYANEVQLSDQSSKLVRLTLEPPPR